MRRVVKWELSDGALFDDAHVAKRRAESRYGQALSRLAHKLVAVEKYTAMCEYLDNDLEEFIALKALKADIELTRDDEG